MVSCPQVSPDVVPYKKAQIWHFLPLEATSYRADVTSNPIFHGGPCPVKNGMPIQK